MANGEGLFAAFEHMLLDRFASIDERFNKQDEVLSEIRSEVRMTNGRVTKLEGNHQVEQALMEQTRAATANREQRHDRFWARTAILLSLIAAAVAGATDGLGHVAGFW